MHVDVDNFNDDRVLHERTSWSFDDLEGTVMVHVVVLKPENPGGIYSSMKKMYIHVAGANKHYTNTKHQIFRLV